MSSVQWREASLSKIAEIERDSVSPEDIHDDDIFVGLEHIDNEGMVDEIHLAKNFNIASAKFRFNNNHILYGKLRPYLRKIALPHGGGICSTDILPILPKMGVVDRGYLFHYLRQQKMVDLATSRSSGASLPRLSPSILSEFPIQFPPIEEQRRIATILDKADAIRRKHQQVLTLADEFLRSAFMRAIDESGENRESVRLSEITIRITDGTHLTPKFVSSGVPFIFVGNFEGGRINFETDKYISEEEYRKLYSRCPVEPNDILYTTVGATYGQAVAVGDFTKFAFQRHVAHIKPDRTRVVPEYLEGIMQLPFIKRQADRRARGAAQPTVNLSDIREFDLPLLGPERQRNLANLVRRVRSCKLRGMNFLATANSLFASISQRAFRGEI